MNLWLKRVLLLSTLGGGFTGLAFTFQLVPQAFDHPANFVVLAIFVAVFGLGVVAGWMLSENELVGIRPTMWFLALQVPFFSSPLIGFGFIAGAGVRIGIGANGLILSGRFGSDGWFSLLQGANWGVAINVLALALFLLCRSAQIQAERTGGAFNSVEQQA
jgi:hypothetical protein